jgi:transposase
MPYNLKKVTNLDYSPTQLRKEAAKYKDLKIAKRIEAIALVLEGLPCTQAAQICHLHYMTVLKLVKKYNRGGLIGITLQRGKKLNLSDKQKAEVKKFAFTKVNGIDLLRHTVDEIQSHIKSKYNIDMLKSSITHLLKEDKEKGSARYVRVSITRQDKDATWFRQEALKDKSKHTRLFLEGIAMLLEGKSRREVYQTLDVTRQAVSLWVKDYNKNGI